MCSMWEIKSIQLKDVSVFSLWTQWFAPYAPKSPLIIHLTLCKQTPLNLIVLWGRNLKIHPFCSSCDDRKPLNKWWATLIWMTLSIFLFRESWLFCLEITDKSEKKSVSWPLLLIIKLLYILSQKWYILKFRPKTIMPFTMKADRTSASVTIPVALCCCS